MSEREEVLFAIIKSYGLEPEHYYGLALWELEDFVFCLEQGELVPIEEEL
jgi:hypothetical protein